MNGSFLSLSLSDGVAPEPDAVGGRLDLARGEDDPHLAGGVPTKT